MRDFVVVRRIFSIKGMSAAELTKCLSTLETWTTDVQRSAEHLVPKAPVPFEVDTVEFVDPDDQELHPLVRPDKRRKGPCTRTELLDSNPAQRRSEIRSTMTLGFCISLSGIRKIKTLHLFGTCLMVPKNDYFTISFAGPSMPGWSDFDNMCTLCSNRGVCAEAEDTNNDQGSSSKADECRIWFLLPRQSFIHDVSSADPLGLRALCLCVLCRNAIALHRL